MAVLAVNPTVDGHCNFTEGPTTCSSCTSGASISVGDNHVAAPAIFNRGYMDFDTSSIPDDATVDSATLRVTVNGRSTSRRFTPANWNVSCQSQQVSFGASLDCSDNNGTWNTQGTISWGSNGNKTYTISTSEINLTGRTAFRFFDNWQHLSSGQSATATCWSKTGTTPPLLTVNYTEVGGTPLRTLMGAGI